MFFAILNVLYKYNILKNERKKKWAYMKNLLKEDLLLR